MLKDVESPSTPTVVETTGLTEEPAAPIASPNELALKEHVPANEKPEILEEVVIEEVSIDGMCGVY